MGSKALAVLLLTAPAAFEASQFCRSVFPRGTSGGRINSRCFYSGVGFETNPARMAVAADWANRLL